MRTKETMGEAGEATLRIDALKEELCAVGRWCAERGWVPATAGNFSFRDAETGRIFITASGLDKGAVRPEDLLEIDLACKVLAGSGKPSAETSLHGVVYRDRPQARAIFHVHSIWNTLLSDRYAAQGEVLLEGYELLKALSLVATHEHLEKVPVLENSQEYDGLARELESRLKGYPGAHGFLLRRHGLYVWGESVAAAKRHLEALEFLFEVEARRLGY